MSNGFGLPAVDFSDIGRWGERWTQAQKELRRVELSKQIGASLKNGDYNGAAGLAFDAGDQQSGLALTKLGESYRQAKLGEKAAADFANSLGGGFGGDDGGGFSPSTGQRRLGGELPSFADQGLPSSGYIADLFRRESGGNATARASTSSATGLGQFTDKTWAGVMRQHPDLGLTADGRTDPQQMLRATQAHTADNADLLKRSNLPVNDASLYSLHFLGAGGGRRFVAGAMADPDRPATAYVSPEQVAANRNVFFDRSGRARTAGEVFGSFEKSFGGRGGGAPARTVSAGQSLFDQDAAGAQGLERSPGTMQATGLPPVQFASLPGPDTPVQGINPALAQVPPSSNPAPSATPDGRLTTDVERSGLPAPPVPGLSDPSRTMTMPGEAPTQVAQMGGSVPAIADRREAVAMQQVRAIPNTGTGLGQRMRLYAQAIANPAMPEGPREVAKQLLGEELQRTRLPDNVKSFMWARANGMTQARSPAEYERESKGAQVVAPGSSVLAPDGQSVAFTVPARDTIGDQVAARQAAAAEMGLAPNSPAWQSYVLTGKMPREDAQPRSASDKKAILEADDAVVSAETVIGNLRQAKELSKKAYEGPAASARGQVTGYFGNEAGLATTELDNLVTTNALGSLKSIFGGNPTEGERKILLDIQGSSSLPDAARQRIYDRAIALAERRLQINRDRAADMRGGTYFQPDGGPQGSRRDAAPQGERRALPAPSPANRADAASAADRFGQLVGSGLSKQQAYERLQAEGY